MASVQDPVNGAIHAHLGSSFEVSGTDCLASLHLSSLCCRARGMSLTGYLRSDQHVWHLSKCLSAIVSVVLVLGADCNDANQDDRPGVPDLVVLVSEASVTCQLLADVPAKWEDRPQRTITRNAVSLLLSQFASAPDSDFSEGWGLFEATLGPLRL